MEQPDQIILRCFDIRWDIDAFYQWVVGDASIRCPKERKFVIGVQIKEYFNNIIVTHPWFLLICLPRGVAVGFIYLTRRTDHCSKLTFNVAQEYRGCGVATAAVAMALKMAFAEMPLLRWVDARVEVYNYAARKVLKKVGFRTVGFWFKTDNRQRHHLRCRYLRD